MARIDTRDRTLLLKLVYYGPAMGGKTTNLQTLHSMLDPARRPELLSLDTHGDRTLFFDLLPLELEDVGGFKLKVRLFTVPGQVHYNATRRIVLRDADAAIFVADSSPDRLDANGESMASLHGNLVANGLQPGTVPIILQANKRDVPHAATVAAVEASLGLKALHEHGRAVSPHVIPASALSGEGVFETFEQSLRAALAAAHQRQGLNRIGLSREGLGLALYEALSPMRARAAAAPSRKASVPPAGASAKPAGHAPPVSPEQVLPREQLLLESVTRALDLAETLGDAQSSTRQLSQRVRELEVVQELSRVLAKATTFNDVAKAVVAAAGGALGERGAASLLAADPKGALAEAALHGVSRDPLLWAGSPPLAAALHRAARPAVYRDIETDLVFGDRELLSSLSPWCTAVACPIAMPSGPHALLVAYGSDHEMPAGPDSLRFVSLVASQAALGLQAVDRHVRLVRHGERLEEEVAARTAELRAAHAELAASSRLKDRVLACVNHELRTPVTKLMAAAQVLQRAKAGAVPPPHLLGQVVDQARHLGGLLDQVLSAQALLADRATVAGTEDEGIIDVGQALEAVTFTCQERAAARRVVLQVASLPPGLGARGDAGSVTLILSQLIDNAVKFTKQGTSVRVGAEAAGPGMLRLVVRDEGPGVKPEDAERIFGAFDQGSADVLTAKPSGLGLGLVIARRLARRLGGDVGTHPGPGGGVFWLELPAGARESHAAGAPPERLLAQA